MSADYRQGLIAELIALTSWVRTYQVDDDPEVNARIREIQAALSERVESLGVAA